MQSFWLLRCFPCRDNYIAARTRVIVIVQGRGIGYNTTVIVLTFVAVKIGGFLSVSAGLNYTTRSQKVALQITDHVQEAAGVFHYGN